MFIIGNRIEPDLYWSNENGWVDVDSADRFSEDEKSYLNLPMEGYWVPLWSIDLIQFARFIAECEAAGVFNSAYMDDVAASMDLSEGQISSIIDRAQNRWDEEKNKI